MSSLGSLYDSIKAEFLADGQTTSVVFGSKQVARQLNQDQSGIANRVVVEPLVGDTIGPIQPPRSPGGNPARIARIDISATIHCWAADVSTPEAASDERAQYDAVLALFTRVMRAIINARSGEVTFGQIRKVRPEKKELVLGQEWAFDMTVIEDCEAVPSGAVAPTTPQMTTTFVLPSPSGG